MHGCVAVETVRITNNVRHSAFGSRVGDPMLQGICEKTVSKTETLGSVEGLRVCCIKYQLGVVSDIDIVVDFLASANHDWCIPDAVSFEWLAQVGCHEAKA